MLRYTSEPSARPSAGLSVERCPHCGELLNAKQPYVDLETRMFHGEGISLHLTQSEAKIIHFLLRRHVASNADLWDELYSLRPADADGPNEKITGVFICKLRQKLERTPYRISTIWGVGYRFHDTRKHSEQYT